MHIGEELIPFAESYAHLRIDINSKFKSIDRSQNACRKRRNAYFALNGISAKTTNPSVLINLYKTVVLPTVLYGFEMWSKMRFNDVSVLNRSQHFIVKRILNLPTLTRSDMCQSILGIYPIETHIYQRKLMFFQIFCKMDTTYVSKTIFMTILFSFLNDNKHRHLGFIPDKTMDSYTILYTWCLYCM